MNSGRGFKISEKVNVDLLNKSQKMIQQHVKDHEKIMKIDPRLVQNLSKIDTIRSLGRFGEFSAPFRAHVGSRSGSGRIRQNL